MLDIYEKVKDQVIGDKVSSDDYYIMKESVQARADSFTKQFKVFKDMANKNGRKFLSFDDYMFTAFPYGIPNLPDYEQIKDIRFGDLLTFEEFREIGSSLEGQYLSIYSSIQMIGSKPELLLQIDPVKDILVRVFGKEGSELIFKGNDMVYKRKSKHL